MDKEIPCLNLLDLILAVFVRRFVRELDQKKGATKPFVLSIISMQE